MFCKRDVIRLAFFCVLFSALDSVYLFTDFFESDYDSLSIAIMDDAVGYNNLYMIVGIVLTAIYILGLNRMDFLNNSAVVVKLGKKRYIARLAGNVLLQAFAISFEYVFAEVLVCSVRFTNRLLVDTGFYQCCILYMLMLFSYFSVVGMSTVLIIIITGRNKVGYLFSIAFFVALNSLALCNIKISLLYSSEFISAWFTRGDFNWLEYVINIAKSVCSFMAIKIVCEIILPRKDMIFDEQQN